MTDQAVALLEHHDLRKTKVRRQVLEVFLSKKEALSHNDIENRFEDIDRITLYRTLRTFEEKGLIHKAIDGSDKQKFALCQDGCTEHDHKDEHAHFHCGNCEKTYCLDGVHAPKITAPAGFQIESYHLVLKGICEECSDLS